MNTSVLAVCIILLGSCQLQQSESRRHVSDHYDPNAYIEDWTSNVDNEADNVSPSYLHFFEQNVSSGYSNQNGAKLRYYVNSTDDYIEKPLMDAYKIFSHKLFDVTKPIIFFCHGYQGVPDGPAVLSVTSFFIKEGKSNVILLNWEYLASMAYPGFVSSYLNWAIPNAIKVGTELAETLLNLSKAGVDLEKVHLIGHSLGAHVFGVTGNRMSEKGVRLARITGLDPAGAVLEMKPAHLRLNPKSARMVTVLHSDPSKYGTSKGLGMVNFWPNYRNRGPILQPGCPEGRHPNFSPEDLCSHHRCWELFLDAYKYPGTLIGSYARNYRIWKNYSKDQRKADVLGLETYDPLAKPGNYYFTTAGKSPYGLGEDGL